MQTLTVQITNRNALKTLNSLREKRFIRIVDDTDLDFPSLPGERLSLRAFKNWIMDSEDAPVIDLKEAKTKWASRKKRLRKFIR